MSNNWLISQTVDLKKSGGRSLDGGVLMLSGDRLGHTWEITVLEDGGPATLTGGSVNGYFARVDGNYVAVNGSISGNICRVTLTQECYAYAGQLRGVMRLTINGQIVTLADVAFRVRAGLTGSPVSPGTTIPSIDDLLAAIDDLEDATAAANAVTGKVYPMMELHYEGREACRNLFRKDHYQNISGSRLANTGALVTDAQTGVYGVSAYIPVVGGRCYFADLGMYSNIERICFYDDTLTALATSTAIVFPNTQAFFAPANAAAMRVTYLLSYADSVCVEEYSPQGVNLFNAYSQFNTDNRYLRRNNQNTAMQWNRSNSWGMSHYIPVTGGQAYRICSTSTQTGQRIEVFDEDFAYLTELYPAEPAVGVYASLTMPAATQSTKAAAWIKFAYTTSMRYSKAAITAGSASNTRYEPYHGAEEGKGDPFKAFLPDYIYCALGRTIELYTSQVVLHPERYTVRWICDTGYFLERKFSVTGSPYVDAEHPGNVGSHSLTLQVLDRHGRMIYEKTATLMITAGLGSGKRLLMIGDSLTKCDKPVLPELVNLSGGNISTVGTTTGSAKDANGTTRATFGEGRSGQGPLFFIQSDSPFFKDGAFNWSNYISALAAMSPAQSAPQAVAIMLGTNWLGQYPRLPASWIVELVSDIRAAASTLPIFVCHTIYRSDQSGIGQETGSDGYSGGTIGATKDIEDEKIMDLAVEVEKQLAAAGLGVSQYVYTVGVGASMDAEYNFGMKAVPVNPRNTDFIEFVPFSPAKNKVDSIHPQDCGYYQIADVIYSALSARL